jgi:hypothetical protein
MDHPRHAAHDGQVLDTAVPQVVHRVEQLLMAA